MPMNQNCRYFESRSYPNGDTVRKCDLDLAPEAPWRCPENCSSFEPRVDIAWSYGSMVTPATPPEPDALDDPDADVAALLDAAEDIVNGAGPSILAEVEAERAAQEGKRPRWKRLFRRGK